MAGPRGVLAVALMCLLQPSSSMLLEETLFGLVLADFFLGSIRAVLSQTWTISKFASGTKKIVWWIAIIILAGFLSRGMAQDFDWILKRFGDLLVFFIVVTEITSVLENLAGIALLLGINVPWMKQLIDLFERWGATEEQEEVKTDALYCSGERDTNHGGHDGGRPGENKNPGGPNPPMS